MAKKSDTAVEAADCFVFYNGRVHAVLNWTQRKSQTDAIISRPLKEEELAVYDKEREANTPAPEIFKKIFPPRIYKILSSKELRTSPKKNVVDLILKRLQCPLPSLHKMTKEDLCTLYEHLGQGNFQLVLHNRDED